jgi:hypothetical protein
MPLSVSYEELRDHLRQFVNTAGDPAPYDFNGVVHLLLASLDNLRQNASEADLEDIGASFDDEQAAFLIRLAERVCRADPAYLVHPASRATPARFGSNSFPRPRGNGWNLASRQGTCRMHH